MPTYDYQCQSCASRFEAFHPLAAPAPGCPSCGGPATRVLLSAPAYHGAMAQGRERAQRSLPRCGKGCRCCP